MKGVLSDFLEKLQEEEAVVAEQLAADTLGLTLRAASNELDRYSYNILRATNPNREQAEQWRFIRLGVARLVKLTFDRVPSFEVPTITLRRQIELSKQVLETVAHLSFIQHGRWSAEFAQAGRCQIEKLSETDFEFCLFTLDAVGLRHRNGNHLLRSPGSCDLCARVVTNPRGIRVANDGGSIPANSSTLWPVNSVGTCPALGRVVLYVRDSSFGRAVSFGTGWDAERPRVRGRRR